ncbi:hypothetical protein [Halorarum salinum]|uniref:Uncharacterized protein n=1 Tax=Halorarum salinum TaxID=2743089 RepID=A0A7D5LAP6_9EURY|nr:hypothetical protein [Halobaculum salinum]QLG61991.1 hypothetical protein HUG12_09760 [Halobaculum salinum]
MPTDKFEDAVPLPFGNEVDPAGRKVSATPIIEFRMDDITVQSSTERGWPTLIVGDDAGTSVGIGLYYPGDWHPVPVDEIDLILKEDQTWAVVVAYRTRRKAISDGNFDFGEFEGYECYEWATEARIEVIEYCTARGITPIFCNPTAPDRYIAYAYQEADSFNDLDRIFGLSRYPTVVERRKKLVNYVIPRDERWADKDTSLQEMAQDMFGEDDS